MIVGESEVRIEFTGELPPDKEGILLQRYHECKDLLESNRDRCGIRWDMAQLLLEALTRECLSRGLLPEVET